MPTSSHFRWAATHGEVRYNRRGIEGGEDVQFPTTGNSGGALPTLPPPNEGNRMNAARALTFALCVAGALVYSSALPARAAQQGACDSRDDLTVVQGSTINETILAEKPVLLDKVCVMGDVSLTGSVSEALVITNSTFAGKVRASRVMFASQVDFTKSAFAEAPEFSGSTFQGDAVFVVGQFATQPATEGVASINFDRATFEDIADFRGAKFFGEASFATATFKMPALFQDAEFHGDTNFSETTFGDAAVFVRTEFNGRCNFYRSSAAGDVRLDSAQMETVTDFREAAVASALSMNSAFIQGQVFFDHVAAGSLDLRDAEIADQTSISMAKFTLGDLFMDPKMIEFVDDDEENVEQIAALKAIEKTYRDDSELGTANNAAYRWQEITDNNRSQPSRAFHVVAWRWIAGYTVRPLNPFLVTLALVFAGTLARILDDKKYGVWRLHGGLAKRRFEEQPNASHEERRVEPGKKKRPTKDTWPWPARAADAFVRAAKVPVFPKPGELLREEDKNRTGAYLVAGMLLIEYLAHKTLNVLLLFAIANAIPRAKDFIDVIVPT